ncbi:MAG: hypothetical protein AAGE76_08710 [Pseudomonadota bacterium]
MQRNTLTLATIISLGLTGAAPAWTDGPALSGMFDDVREIPDLPTIDSPAWALISSVDVAEVETAAGWEVRKAFPADLIAAAERPFEVTGYLIPVVPAAEFSQLLLVRDPADCPFCAGGYGTVLEVELARPVRDVAEFFRVKLRGDLVLVHDTDTTQAVRVSGARILE